MVRTKRLELLRLTALDPKSSVYANSTTFARYGTGCGTCTHTPQRAPLFESGTAAIYVNPVLVDRVGVEPTMYLTSRIYSPLPSPLGTPIHIIYINHLLMVSIIW